MIVIAQSRCKPWIICAVSSRLNSCQLKNNKESGSSLLIRLWLCCFFKEIFSIPQIFHVVYQTHTWSSNIMKKTIWLVYKLESLKVIHHFKGVFACPSFPWNYTKFPCFPSLPLFDCINSPSNQFHGTTSYGHFFPFPQIPALPWVIFVNENIF